MPSVPSGAYPAQWAQAAYAPPSQPLVAPFTPPPFPAPAAPPPVADAPRLTASLRLTGLAVVMLVVITIIAFTAPVAVASARTIAYPKPSISISAPNTATIQMGDNVSLSATVIHGRDLTFNWQFGDGSSASGQSVSHQFTQHGPNTVTLTATDPIGQSASATQNFTVLYPAPTANFTYQADSYIACAIDFDASASTAPGNGDSIANYAWDFGDGNTVANGYSSPTEYYSVAGTYNVTLTVTEQDNLTASTQQQVVVTC